MAIGARLKELRIKKNKSLQDVADAVGASKAHIWELERGGAKNPSMDLLTKLAEYFEVSVSNLVGEAPSSEEQEDLIVLYRELKELDKKDRDAFLDLMRRFKGRKDQG